MPDLEVVLHDAVGDIAEVDVSGDVERRVRGRRTRRRVVLAAVSVAAVAAVVGGVIAGSDDHASVRVAGQEDLPSGAPVFSTPTGVVLLLDDGYDGVAALDLDSGVVGRRIVEGQLAGDQPFRLFRVDDSLIVGWGEVYAAPLSGDPSVLLGEATIAIPAAEAGSLWLATWSEGRIGQGNLSLRLVDSEGRTLMEGAGPPDGGYPSLGVPGGVAVETPTGQLLWDVEAQAPLGTLPAGDAIAVTSDRIIWCEASCLSLRVRDLATGEDTGINLPEGFTGIDPDPANAAISPDGSKLVFYATAPTNEGTSTTASDTEGELLVADLQSTAVARPIGERVPSLTVPQWSPDGRYVLWATRSYGGTTTEVGRYDVSSGAVESRRLPFGGSLRSVAVERTRARSFLPSQIGRPSDCQPPGIQPSGRSGLCGFRVTEGATETVDVPGVRGLSVNVARSQLEAAGLAFSINDGDPGVNDAIVVSLEPPEGSSVPFGSVVGVRTALVTDEVCSGLDALPERTGDALQLAQEARFAEAIQAAASAAREPLRTDIETVLAEVRAGSDLAAAGVEVARALDRIAIHRDACAIR